MIETAIKELLSSDPALLLLVRERVYPVVLPQAPDYPAMTFQIVSGLPEYHLQGRANLCASRVQFDLFALTFDKLNELKHAFLSLMSGFRNSGQRPGIIQGAFVQGEFEDVEAAIKRTNEARRKTIDFIIWHEETYA
jgi:hypothetical protein